VFAKSKTMKRNSTVSHSRAHHHEKVKEHAKSLLAATSHITDSKVSEAHGKLSELLDDARESIDYVEEKAVEAAKQTTEYIREKPMQAVGLAIAVGALLGFCIARRK
jgi:ElaB/YqjD/DUF883 family membrane-anchored ribosome-binding protein